MNWKKFFTAAVLAGSIGLSAGSALAASGAELVAAGNEAYEAKKYLQAWNSYGAALQEDASLAAAYAGRGRVLCRQGKNQEALAEFARALELEPENGAFYAYRSQAFTNMGDHERQLADLQQALRLMPGELALYANSIMALKEMQRQDEAVPLADTVVRLYQEKAYTSVLLPELDAEVLSNLLGAVASVYANCSQKDYARTVEVCSMALKEYEQAPAVYMLRATAYPKLGKHQAGLEDCRRGLELAEAQGMGSMRPMFNLLTGGIYYAMKDYPSALSYTDLVLQQQENWKDNYLLRHQIYQAMGDKAGAEAAARRFLELGGTAKELKD